jgi:hypothetical protein
MRVIRKRLRELVLASVPAAALQAGCLRAPADATEGSSSESTATSAGTTGRASSTTSPATATVGSIGGSGATGSTLSATGGSSSSGTFVGSSSGTSGTGSSGSSGACASTTGCGGTFCGCQTDVAVVPAQPDGPDSCGGLSTATCTTVCSDFLDAGSPPFHPFLIGCEVIDGGADPSTGQPDWVVSCAVSYGCTGRRPEGLQPAELAARDGAGAYLARAAFLEAASIPAFRRLAQELNVHGAPAALVDRARLAVKEEARHARTMSRLAARRGAKPSRPRHAAFAPRSLEELVLENAVEGCVGETFGAALAHWQALTASDPELRAAMEQIAEDEEGHAELAWAVEAWALPSLSPEARARVHAARAEAVGGLQGGLERSWDEASDRALGLPSREQLSALIGRMRREIWAT